MSASCCQGRSLISCTISCISTLPRNASLIRQIRKLSALSALQGSTDTLVYYENQFYHLAWRRWMVKKEKIFPLDFFNQWKVSESFLHNFPLAAFCKVASDWIGWIFNHSEPSPSIKWHICIDWCSLFKLSFNHFPNFCQLQLDIGFIPLCFAKGVTRDPDNGKIFANIWYHHSYPLAMNAMNTIQIQQQSYVALIHGIQTARRWSR